MLFLMEADLPNFSLGARTRRWPLVILLSMVLFGIKPSNLWAADDITLREGWEVQSSAKVSAAAEKVSSQGFDTKGWYKTNAPKTVFAVLVENGVYKDPYFGMNLRSIPGIEYPIGGQFANLDMPANSPYAVPWWYRKEFEVPKQFKGRTVWMAFRGINYRAEIWINGKKVAGSDQVVGAFRRYEFDVTALVHEGKKNVVAIAVSAPKAGELGITFVDWNPMPPDKEMGLWQEVVLSGSGPVSVRHPFVDSRFDLPGVEKARLTVRAQLQNTSGSSVKGTVKGKITGASNPIEFALPVELAANESREIVISPDAIAALNIDKPRLWWPSQMGEPYLHQLTLEFHPDSGSISDSQTISFGIDQIDSELTADGYRLFKINGKPILIRGAGWTPDMMLRVDESRRAAEFRYVEEMGMNTIRLEGKLEDDSFFQRADRDGILVMAGWCCCDAWEKWNKWGDENRHVSVDSLRDQMLRLRSHASMLVWLNGSDNPPPPEREQAYLNIEKETNWPRPTLSSATAKKTEVTGDSGVKMNGPYEYVSPNYWLTDTKAGGAFGFSTEISPGPAVPPLEELQSMFPPDKLWPINEVWNFHAGGGEFKDIHVYTEALEARYGKAKNAADFAWKSQATTYEAERAMFEGYSRNKCKSTGVIQWMLNNSWPGIIWHLYDYSLRPAGGYFGTKKALEPLHVQFSYDDRGVAVVNSTQQPEKNLKVSAKLYSLDAKELFSKEAVTGVEADGVARLFAIPEPAANYTAYFLALELHRPNGDLASRNFYWLSAKPDVLAFDQTKWFYTPLTAFADFTPLQAMPKANVKATLKTQESGDETAGKVLVENSGGSIAFLVRLRLLKGKDGPEILPVFWEDNYISLLPGEKREIAVRVRKTDAGKSKPVLAIDGYNVAPTGD
jgi:exo-1,4-beta-D-glucosaminidase